MSLLQFSLRLFVVFIIAKTIKKLMHVRTLVLLLETILTNGYHVEIISYILWSAANIKSRIFLIQVCSCNYTKNGFKYYHETCFCE